MNIVETLIEDIIIDINNVRVHDRKSIESIKKSLQEFEQYKPIVVQKSSNVIIAGNGTYQAMKELGWEKINCLFLDLDDEQSKILSVIDNQTSDLSEWDNNALTECLYNLDDKYQDISGFFQEDINNLMNRIEHFDKSDMTEKMNTPTLQCPHCNHQFNENFN